MLQFEILPDRKVLIVKPKEPLETADFERLSAEVDALIRERGKLKGVLVDAPAFPGWASFAAFSAHVTFTQHDKVSARSGRERARRLRAVPERAWRTSKRRLPHRASPTNVC